MQQSESNEWCVDNHMAEREEFSPEDMQYDSHNDQRKAYQNHLNEKKPNPTLSGHFAA